MYYSSAEEKFLQDRFLIFIPAYNCAQQIGRTLQQLREVEGLNCVALVLDNRSPDQTVEAAKDAARHLKIPVHIAINDENYGLGGSHKAAFLYALKHNFDYLIVLHGDDQGNIKDIVPLIKKGIHHEADALLGARFMKGARLIGYSKFRTFGNYVFNGLFSAVAGNALKDLGSGLNLYKVKVLQDRKWLHFGNDLTFNYYMILASTAWKWRLHFFPISWREDDQVSNVKLFKQARKTLKLLARFALFKEKFLSDDHAGRGDSLYTFQIVANNDKAEQSS